jgi:branched-chain amino acid transport system substrate-binding protein
MMKSAKQVAGFLLILVITVSLGGIIAAFKISQKNEPVRIGLLIPDKNSTAAILGAELAINKANRDGGLSGRPFQVVVRSLEGPWGTGSKEAVNLIFNEKVWALLGSQDGRNAHLIEQVSAKTRVVFLSSWTGDPTLAQAFIPWFFNCAPNDMQRADALFREIFSEGKYTRPAIITDGGYDSKSIEKYFLEKVSGSGKKEAARFVCSLSSSGMNSLIDSVKMVHPDCMIILGEPGTLLRLIGYMKGRAFSLPLFSTLEVLNEDQISPKEMSELSNITFVSPSKYNDPGYIEFCREFSFANSKDPGPVAAYAYDGMTMLISAIRESGAPDYLKIKQSLLNMDYRGVTGRIRFDDMGNRSCSLYPAVILNGKLVTPENRVP